MSISFFGDRSHAPPSDELERALGRSAPAWKGLIEAIGKAFPPLVVEWGYTSKTTGWGLRLKRENRTVLYMTPCEGFFLASFVLGEKAAAAARARGLPEAVLLAIDGAPRYAEGRGVRFEIRTLRDLKSIKELADIKMST